MATIVNDRDVRLQATSPRYAPVSVFRLLLLASDTPVFKGSGTATFTATLTGLTGPATWAITGGTLTGSTANVRTLTFANMSANTAVITATVTEGGTSYIASTVVVKVVDGTNGSNGSNGSNGARGTVTIAASGYSTWSDAAAVAELSAAGYGSPVNRDIVTLYDSTHSVTKFYQSGTWFVLTAYVNGNMLVSGTLSASAIFGGTLSAVTIGLGSGGTPGGYAFQVASNGQSWVESLIAYKTCVFSNATSSGSTPLLAVAFGSGLAGVTGTSDATGGSGAHGVRGTNNSNSASGIVGGANGYDFYAEGPGPNGPFTGAHDIVIPNGTDLALGDIVLDTSCRVRRGWSNTIFEAALSSSPNQKNVIGVLSMLIGPLSEHQPAAYIDNVYAGVDPAGIVTRNCRMSPEYVRDKDLYQLAAANALGEGQMNVCGEGGDIAAGDFIVTSSTAGKGMRQADNILRNYTVAKARESVVFSSPEEIRQIACFYVAG